MKTISKTPQYAQAKSKIIREHEDPGAYYCTFEKLGWYGKYYYKCSICCMIGESAQMGSHYSRKHPWLFTDENIAKDVIKMHCFQDVTFETTGYRDYSPRLSAEEFVALVKKNTGSVIEIGTTACGFGSQMKSYQKASAGSAPKNLFATYKMSASVFKVENLFKVSTL